jgi:hypothetical protein
MSASRIRTIVAGSAMCALLAACSSGSAGAYQLSLDNVGRIPGVDASSGVVVADGVRAELSTLEGSVLGPSAAGNRLLMIGDSILAGTASRYGGEMCNTLVPMGWRVALEAEAGQMVGFGRTVLRDRIYEGWDAAVVFLGTNYGGIIDSYTRDLTAIVESLAPRPTLLLTPTEFRSSMKQVTEAIRVIAAKNPHVSVLDWGTASLQPGVLNKDRVHPSVAGRKVLVASIAAAVGSPPTGVGTCLASKYTNDTLVDDDIMPSVNTSVAPAATTTVPTTTPLVAE